MSKNHPWFQQWNHEEKELARVIQHERKLSRKDRIDLEIQVGRYNKECGPVITYNLKETV